MITYLVPPRLICQTCPVAATCHHLASYQTSCIWLSDEWTTIKNICTDLYGGTRAFLRLWDLVIDEMKCLEEWNMALPGDEDNLNQLKLSRNSSVKIISCPKLRFKPCPPQCGSLWIERSDEVMLSSLGNRGQVGASAVKDLLVNCCAVPLHHWSLLGQLPYLKNLTLVNCRDLTCSSQDFLGGLTSLKSLVVTRALSLPERLGDLTSLTELEIYECNSIKTVPASMHKLTHRPANFNSA
ncbi:hypothetical protein HU200_042370 [Digitaria exilis]|uniref:Uncharacterized protein n=1 Tax=Digitaria exilis TaxID=1010633 RepID=A0A835B5Y0_9POAL|nr:hypothetical protein HU200_042370 [Digitaria exilis]